MKCLDGLPGVYLRTLLPTHTLRVPSLSSTKLGGHIAKVISQLVAQEWQRKSSQNLTNTNKLTWQLWVLTTAMFIVYIHYDNIRCFTACEWDMRWLHTVAKMCCTFTTEMTFLCWVKNESLCCIFLWWWYLTEFFIYGFIRLQKLRELVERGEIIAHTYLPAGTMSQAACVHVVRRSGFGGRPEDRERTFFGVG